MSQEIELEILTSDPIELEVASDEENLPLETQEFVRGGGGGGTSDYEDMDNLPEINGVTLIGDKSAADLGLAAASAIPADTALNFTATYTISGTTVTCDKTYAQILAAFVAGKEVVAKISGDVIAQTDSASVASGTIKISVTIGISALILSHASDDTITRNNIYGQPEISVTGLLKRDSNGNIVAAVPGTDYIDSESVSSVNGQTGAVLLDAADVGALPDSATASDVGAVASNQGVAHAGKFMMVGSDGVVAPIAMAAWQGGSY